MDFPSPKSRTWKPAEPINHPQSTEEKLIQRLLNVREANTAAISRAINEGMAFNVFVSLSERLQLPHDTLANLLDISTSTLYRRKKKGQFERAESDRLWRYLHLYAKAVDVLEDEDAAREWLTSPKLALGNLTPLETAETAPGAREVERLLIRIEHGVFG